MPQGGKGKQVLVKLLDMYEQTQEERDRAVVEATELPRVFSANRGQDRLNSLLEFEF